MNKDIKKLLLLSLALVIYTPFTFNMEAPKPAPAPGDKRTADQAFEDETTEISEQDKTSYKSGPRSQKVLCPHCPKQIASYNLAIHIKRMHTQKVKTILCDYPSCGTMVSSINFKRHWNNIHGPNSKLVDCPHECGLKISRAGLQGHIQRMHTETQKVLCPYDGCNERITAPHLTRHIANKHKKRKTITCPECDKKINEGNFNRHSREVHGPLGQHVRCTFDQCKVFIKAYYLKEHLARVHGVKE